MSAIRTETIELVRALKRHAGNLMLYFDKYKEVTSKAGCDKYGAVFNGDSRFTVFSASANFTAWTGYYGNSSCSTFGSFDSKLMAPYVTRALNNLKREIFSEIAREMRLDASKLQDKAQSEIDALQELVKSLSDDMDNEGAAA